jgi:hypothetical protein
LKKVESHDAYEMLTQTNDSIIEELKSKGVVRRPYCEEPMPVAAVVGADPILFLVGRLEYLLLNLSMT